MLECPMNECRTCKYFTHTGPYGDCRRFPQYVKRGPTDGCGEHDIALHDADLPRASAMRDDWVDSTK